MSTKFDGIKNLLTKMGEDKENPATSSGIFLSHIEKTKHGIFSSAFSRSTTDVNPQLGEMSAAYERPITTPGTRHQPKLMRLWERQQVRQTAVRRQSPRRRVGMRRTTMLSAASVASTRTKAS